MPTANPEDFWRKTINDMTASLPDDGNTAPEIEEIKKKTLGNQKVLVHKITTQIYVLTDIQGKLYTTSTSQKMHILGSMTLARALKMAQEDNIS